MTSSTSSRTDPSLTTVAWGSLAVVAVAVMTGLLVAQALVAVGLGQDGTGFSADSVASLVVTGLGLGIGSYVLAQRLGVPTLLHLVVGTLGAVVLGLATFITGPGPVVSGVVLAAYVVLSVVGLSWGAASRSLD